MKQFNKDAALLRSDLDQIKSKLSAPALVSQWREQKFWFDNLIQNGTFDVSTTGWAAMQSAVLSVASSALRMTWGASTYGGANQLITMQGITGRSFRLNGDAVGRTGTNQQAWIGTSQSNASMLQIDPVAVGAFEGDFVASADAFYITLITNMVSGQYGDFDNLSIFETDGTDIIHRLPEGWLPADVFVDGLLIREGAAHDYTVETDGFDKWIKPAVAPGALTETCIMGVRKV